MGHWFRKLLCLGESVSEILGIVLKIVVTALSHTIAHPNQRCMHNLMGWSTT